MRRFVCGVEGADEGEQDKGGGVEQNSVHGFNSLPVADRSLHSMGVSDPSKTPTGTTITGLMTAFLSRSPKASIGLEFSP